jgi:hypothetical protein
MTFATGVPATLHTRPKAANLAATCEPWIPTHATVVVRCSQTDAPCQTIMLQADPGRAAPVLRMGVECRAAMFRYARDDVGGRHAMVATQRGNGAGFVTVARTAFVQGWRLPPECIHVTPTLSSRRAAFVTPNKQSQSRHQFANHRAPP